MKKIHLRIEEIIAITPTWVANEGVVTEVRKVDGQIITETTYTHTLLRRIMKERGVNYTEYRKAFMALWFHRENIPIFLDDLCLIPYKAHHDDDRFHHHGVHGYVRLDLIDRLIGDDKACAILLFDGSELKTVQSKSSLSRHMELGYGVAYRSQADDEERANKVKKQKVDLARQGYLLRQQEEPDSEAQAKVPLTVNQVLANLGADELELLLFLLKILKRRF